MEFGIQIRIFTFRIKIYFFLKKHINNFICFVNFMTTFIFSVKNEMKFYISLVFVKN